MIAIEETTTVLQDGKLILKRPEFKAGEQVKVIVLIETANSKPAAPSVPSGRRLKGDWGVALADLGQQYTSVELQHKALEWWGY